MLHRRDLEAELWVKSRELKLTQDQLTVEREKTSLLTLRVEILKEDLAKLLKHTQELASQPVPTRSKTPLYMSESEEDIRFMKETQQISMAEAEELLRALEFDNEIVLDYDEDQSTI